jgi:hypothetical protein
MIKQKEKIIQKSLFNIPCWKIQITNFEEKKKELVELLESYPEEKKGIETFATNRHSDRFGFVRRFVSIMNEEVDLFAKDIKKDFAIHEMWSVIYDKEDEQWPHNHGSWGLTGILYLDLSENCSPTEYIQPWNDYEDDKTIVFTVDVAEGDIVIVPSFILHFSKPNKSNSKKRIIAWDMKILSDKDSVKAFEREKYKR